MASATTTQVEDAATNAVVHHTAGPRRRPMRAASATNGSVFPIGSTSDTAAGTSTATNGNRWRQNRNTDRPTATSMARTGIRDRDKDVPLWAPQPHGEKTALKRLRKPSSRT